MNPKLRMDFRIDMSHVWNAKWWSVADTKMCTVQTSECKLWLFTEQLVLNLDTTQLIIIISTNIHQRLDSGVARILYRHNVFSIFVESVLAVQATTPLHHSENANQSTWKRLMTSEFWQCKWTQDNFSFYLAAHTFDIMKQLTETTTTTTNITESRDKERAIRTSRISVKWDQKASVWQLNKPDKRYDEDVCRNKWKYVHYTART